MRCGVTSFVGTFGNIADPSGAEFAVALYANLLAGTTVAEALRAARKQTARATLDAGMFYTAHGYPGFRLTEPNQSERTRTSVARAVAQAKVSARWQEYRRPRPTR